MEDMKLPKGWVKTTVGEFMTEVKDRISPDDFGDAKYIGLEHLQKGGGIIKYGSAEALKSQKSVFKKSDILYGKLRPYLNKRAIATASGISSTDILIYRNQEEVSAKYFYYFLGLSKTIRETNAQAKGINLPRISSKLLNQFPFPLPPLAEQKRMVKKLDGLFGHLEVLQGKLARIPDLMKDFRQSVLTQAVTGKLTEEWREGRVLEKLNISKVDERRLENYENQCKLAKQEERKKPKKIFNLDKKISLDATSLYEKLPNSWNAVPMVWVSGNKPDSIVDGPFGSSINVKTDYIEKGIPVIRMLNVRPFFFNEVKLKYINPLKFAQLRRHNILPNDILLAKVGATIGDCCLYPPGKPEAMLSTTGNCRIRVDNDVINEKYLELFLNSKTHTLKSIASQTAQPFLNMKTVKSFPIFLPTVTEQTEIITRVQTLFTKSDQILSRYKILKEKIDTLPQAILAKAFRGDLTEQLDTDGDARDLLAEIAALREEVKGKKVKKKK